MMTPITGEVYLKLSVEDVNHINALIERDTPKALHKYDYSDPEKRPLYFCPDCGTGVYHSEAEFCIKCGCRFLPIEEAITTQTFE